MSRGFLISLFAFLLVVVAVTLWVISLPETASISEPAITINASTGEKLFWGKATCHVCHRIGERGYALRGPNLGESQDGSVISIRARERARELGLKNSVAYLVQSLARPEAFVVPGYNNEMPLVSKPPVALYPSEIKAIITYLESLDGDTAYTEIDLPAELTNNREPEIAEPQPDFSGNAETGRSLFFDLNGPAACASCHLTSDSAGDQQQVRHRGPDLTAVATFRTAEHLYRKIVKPDSNIVSGYEDVLIKTAAGTFLVGRMQRESSGEVVLTNNLGEQTVIAPEKISTIVGQQKSAMPGNFTDILSDQQIHDLVAYLLTQTGQPDSQQPQNQ